MNRKPQQLSIQPRKNRQSPGKTKAKFTKDPDAFPCPVCGESVFEWGRVQGATFYTKTVGTFSMDQQRLRARACQTCGNVLTFLEG